LGNSASSKIQDIADHTPGLSIAEAKDGNAMIYIRGIESSKYNPESVAMRFDKFLCRL
jgi:hypothetical protein